MEKINLAIERSRASLFRAFTRGVAVASKLGLGRRLPFLRRAYFAMIRALRPGVTTVGPWTVYFHRSDNAVSHSLRNGGGYEPFERELFSALLRPGDAAIDVGANIGVHTLAMSQACGANGKVLAVEPDPENGALWRKNMEANRCANVELLPIAASDQPGTLQLFLSPENRGDHRVYDPQDGRASVSVPSRRLDDLILERGLKPRLFKIDVQGWEHQAVSGALPALQGDYPFALVTEFWSPGLASAGSSAQAYLRLLDSLGLTLFEIDNVNFRLTPVPPDRATLLGEVRDTNLLGLRNIAPESVPFLARALAQVPGGRSSSHEQ